MENQNNERRKVSRQLWKPNRILRILSVFWTGFYSCLKIALGAFITVAIIAGVCLLIFVGTLGDYLEDEILPNSEVTLEGFDISQNSNTYYLDENGDLQVLQKLHATTVSNRATYEEIPKHMINAAIAIEDKRFYEHQGVDWFTTIKACAGMFFGGGTAGGSSLTQQLIKNLTGENSFTVQRKVMEIFRAVCVERTSTKDQIIELYLNTVYFGNGYNGVRSAAEYYFGKIGRAHV